MRVTGPLLVALLLVPLSAAQGDRDLPAEVRDGAEVHIYLSFTADSTYGYSGEDSTRFDGGGSTTDRMSGNGGSRVEWGASTTLRVEDDGRLRGSLIGEWESAGSSSSTGEHETVSPDGYGSLVHESISCSGSGRGPFAYEVEASVEQEGLRLSLTGMAEAYATTPGGCFRQKVETHGEERETSQSTYPFEQSVALLPLKTRHEGEVSLLVPYHGRATLPHRHNGPLGDEQGPGAGYCAVAIADFATGTCASAGSVTARAFVDPCPYLRKAYPKHHAALAAVDPPAAGADEAAVRAWAAKTQPLVQRVLSDQRTWQLFGCEGDLAPDPWEAIQRAQILQRDALLALLREGKLSQQGISELLGAERSLQLLGDTSAGDSGGTLGEILAAMPASPEGKIDARAHSPVSLHVYAEDGGHVGWNVTTNASESTIAGATYEGAPGGPQIIQLPAGLYKVVVDEQGPGKYLLEVARNGTSVLAEDAALVTSRPGRTTTTHYLAVDGWEGPRLDAFPVRRGATPAVQPFFDEGRPATGAGPSSGPGEEGPGAIVTDPAMVETDERPAPWGASAPIVALLLAALAAARNKDRPRSR